MTRPLFREEAIRNATRRLHGVVTVALPAPVWISGVVLVAAVFAALAFAATATYARKETVIGWVAPTTGLVRVSPKATGVVERVVVVEGAQVAAGAEIARLVVSADIGSGRVGDAMLAGLATEARAAERSAAAAVARLGADANAARRELNQFSIEREELEKQGTLEARQFELAQQDVARAEAVAARGYLPARELDSRRAAAIAAEQRVSETRRRVVSVDRQIAALNARIGSAMIEVSAARAQDEAARAALAQRQAEAEARTSQIATAPVAGRVAAVPAHVGQLAGPGDAIAIIIPEGSTLIAELYVPSRAAGFIRAGQDVRLKYQAFPFQRFGVGDATIAAVSQTVLAPEDVSIPGVSVAEPVFRVRARLASVTVQAYGDAMPVQPGMLLTADIVIDRRTLIEWLLDPVLAAR